MNIIQLFVKVNTVAALTITSERERGDEDGETDEGEDHWELHSTNGLPLLASEHT